MSNILTCVTPETAVDRALEGLLGEGERLAKLRGSQHVVVVAETAAEVSEVAQKHSDLVVEISDAGFQQYQPENCLAVLAAVCQQLEPAIVLLGQDAYSQEVAARLGARLGGCSLGDAQAVELVDDKVRVKRSVYGGKAVAYVQANLTPVVIWLRARAFAAEAARENVAQVESKSVLSVEQLAELPAVSITAKQKEESTGVKLEDAQVIVSGGRGLGGPEPFQELDRLAEVMSGQVAASRAACDSGWVPPGYQVGQTGKKVAPELYLAIAISGASQHLMGISDAKVVAAINTDPDAPIFKRAQIGLVEDWKQAVGPLREKLAELQD